MTFKVDFSGQTVGWFNDRLKEERLIFKPPFQRNPVWLDKHKAYLIDTVLRQLPVPEVYIQKDTDEFGASTYSVIDGQQRIRALLDFPKGKIELEERYSPGKAGCRWEDLNPAEKVRFWNYRLVVREVEGASETELRDLFQRLNQHTVALNAQEIRNARYKGEFITAVTELADEDFWAENKIVSAAEIRRMLDIEYIAELLIGVMHGPQNKKSSLDRLFEAYEEKIPNKLSWLAKFENARKLTKQLVPDLAGSRWHNKSDYYTLFLTCSEFSEVGKLSKERTAAAVDALKQFGDEVDLDLSKESNKHKPKKAVHDYALAVVKAASDKASRQSRCDILKETLTPFFS